MTTQEDFVDSADQEFAVWSLIYTVHIFHSLLWLNCFFMLQWKCIFSQWKSMIYLFGSEFY